MALPSTTTPTVVGEAIIAYHDILVAAANADEEPLFDPATYSRWAPTGADNAVLTAASPATADYIAIAAHNLGTAGIEIDVAVRSSGVGAFSDVLTNFTPTDDEPIIILFNSQTVQGVRITVDGACEIGRMMCGVRLTMERPLYGGHAVAALNPATEYRTRMSESGQFLGRDIVRKGTSTQFAWKNLTAAWVRSTFMPFVQQARTKPFVIGWRDDVEVQSNVLDECIYAHTTGDIQIVNSGMRDLLNATMQVRGHSDV